MNAAAASPTPGRALPRGPHGLPREAVLSSQRGRLLDAMAETVAAKGYPAVTVGDVVAAAGVSRKTFYEHFPGKEDCFLAAYDAGVELLVARIEAAEEGQPTFAACIRAGAHAYLETLSGEPAFARTFLLEIRAAGPRALERRAEVLERFRVRLAGVHRRFAARPGGDGAGGPDALLTALVGGHDAVVSEWVRAGRTHELPALEPTLVFMHLALFGAAGELAEAS